MLLKIHTQVQPNKVHINTSWYLVDVSNIENYLTSSIFKSELDTTSLITWSIAVNNTTDELYAIAIVNYDDGTSSKIGPVPVKSAATSQIITSLVGSGVDTPSFKNITNLFTGATGDITISTSTIRPNTNILKSKYWVVMDADTKSIIYTETNTTDLVLNQTKLPLQNYKKLIIVCVFTATNNVASKPAILELDVTEYNLPLVTNRIDADLDNTLHVVNTGLNAIISSFKVIDSDRKIVYANTTDTLKIPHGAIAHNTEYQLDVYFRIGTKEIKKSYTLITINPSVKRDIVLTGVDSIDSIQYPNIIAGSRTEVLSGGMLVTTKPLVKTPRSYLAVYDYINEEDLGLEYPLPQGTTDKIVTIYNFNSVFIYTTLYDVATKTLTRYKMNSEYIKSLGSPSPFINISNSSSNMAIFSHNEMYVIADFKIKKVDLNTSIADILDLPVDTYLPDSDADFRVDFINDNEMYIVTNDNSILLFNTHTRSIDKLNVFTRANDRINTAVTSNGGLLIVDGNTHTHLYNRETDTVTTTAEAVIGLIVENNGTIHKVV